MSMRQTVLAVALCSAVSFLVGLTVAGEPSLEAPPAARAAAQPLRASPAPRATGVAVPGAPSFADVAERINPAVVNIDSASRGGRDARRRRGTEDSGDARDFHLPRPGSGSGFLIDRQ